MESLVDKQKVTQIAAVLNMEEICEHIRQGQDGGGREFYQSLLVNVNNLGRMEWVVDENPLIVAVECDRLDLVDAFIHLGVHVNAIQKLNNCTKVSKEEFDLNKTKNLKYSFLFRLH